MRIALVINAASGSLGNGVDPAQLRQRLADAGFEVVVEPNDTAPLPRRLEEAANRPGIGAVVVAGGDGTLSCAAATLAGRELPLGILPLGTMNLLARDLGLPLDLDAALATLATGVRRRIDIGDLGQPGDGASSRGRLRRRTPRGAPGDDPGCRSGQHRRAPQPGPRDSGGQGCLRPALARGLREDTIARPAQGGPLRPVRAARSSGWRNTFLHGPPIRASHPAWGPGRNRHGSACAWPRAIAHRTRRPRARARSGGERSLKRHRHRRH